MNALLEVWLQEALRGLPPGVERRLRGEYEAHLCEHLANGGGPDPVPLLGRPQDINRRLRGLYMSAQELKNVQAGKTPQFRLSIVLLLGCGGMNLLLLGGTPYARAPLTGFGVALFLALCLWVLTQGLRPEERTLLRGAAGSLLVFFGLWLGCVADGWLGRSAPLSFLMIGVGLSYVWTVLSIHGKLQQLRRTLALEAA